MLSILWYSPFIVVVLSILILHYRRICNHPSDLSSFTSNLTSAFASPPSPTPDSLHPSTHPTQNQTYLPLNHHLSPWSSFFEMYPQRKSPHPLIRSLHLQPSSLPILSHLPPSSQPPPTPCQNQPCCLSPSAHPWLLSLPEAPL